VRDKVRCVIPGALNGSSYVLYCDVIIKYETKFTQFAEIVIKLKTKVA